MVVFGHVADRVGRSALYGFEIIIVMAAIGGAAFSSAGFMIHNGESSSLSIYAALLFFRFLLGLGIGAEVRYYSFVFCQASLCDNSPSSSHQKITNNLQDLHC